MNLPNKLTMFRIFMTLAVVALIGINWSLLNINWPIYLIGGKVVLRLNYLIAGVLFVVAAVTDMLDGYIARKKNLVTDFGKTFDAIADKVLVNAVLIVLAYNRDITLVVPVIIISRDIIVDAIKSVSSAKGNVIGASQAGKIKTVFMMFGMSLALFENLPMEFFGIALDQLLILIATCLSIYSGIEYYLVNKELFSEK
jgi:CDP-diacylglycerol--glycerol-3-phosphate 3-phosphatidyltransferase